MAATDWPADWPAFTPPWWLSGGHAQTLAAAFWPSRLPAYSATARRVELDDGDVLVLHDDCPASWRAGDAAAIVMHGLGGCHLSPLLVRLSVKLTARGVRVFRMDLRGSGAGLGLARRPYHAGCSNDLAAAVDSVLSWCGGAVPPRLTLIGVSLSGNILLKYLGEAPERVPSAVVRAIAVNPPIDLARSIATLSHPVNRLYDRHFVRALLRRLNEHRQQLADTPVPYPMPRLRCLYDFDNWYTAPMSGFPDAPTYYARCSANQFVPRIAAPTWVVTSRDDPLVPAAMFAESHPHWPDNVRLTIVPGGGHVGYIAQASGGDSDVHWLEWRLADLVTGSTGLQQ